MCENVNIVGVSRNFDPIVKTKNKNLDITDINMKPLSIQAALRLFIYSRTPQRLYAEFPGMASKEIQQQIKLHPCGYLASRYNVTNQKSNHGVFFSDTASYML